MKPSFASCFYARQCACYFAAIISFYIPLCAAPQAPLVEYVANHSLTELSTGLASGIIWPTLNEQSGPDRQLALAFLKECSREREAAVKYHRSLAPTIYIQLLEPMRRAGGYLNAVLQTTLYRMALTEIATTLIRNPERVDEFDAELASLQPGPWKAIRIGSLIADHFHDTKLEEEYNKWNEREILGRIGKLFGKPTLGRAQATSGLIENPSPSDLAYRAAETEWLRSYAIPGLMSFLKHGGHLRDLDAGHITQFLQLMGKDVDKFQFLLFGVNELSTHALIDLRDNYANPEKPPAFLRLALN